MLLLPLLSLQLLPLQLLQLQSRLQQHVDSAAAAGCWQLLLLLGGSSVQKSWRRFTTPTLVGSLLCQELRFH